MGLSRIAPWVVFATACGGVSAHGVVPEPSNARWLMHTLGPDFAADLAHLDPESPWDPADWTELGWRLRARAPNPMDRANEVRTVSP